MSGAAVLLSLLMQVLRIAVPYVLAALGGAVCERAGVINIALEGLLLAGAFGAAAGSLAGGEQVGPWLGLLAGVAAAVALAALLGLATLTLEANQVVAGVAATLLASGVTRFALKAAYGSSSNSPRVPALPEWPLMLATALAVAAVHLGLSRTRIGLRLRASGEHPEALRSLGVAPMPLRWLGLLASGVLAGLGGVWLAYDQHKFVANMSAGRGFIALAAMILGGWSPLGATAACLLFAAAETAGLRLSAAGVGAGGVLQALPYLVTLLALGLRGGRQVAPRALGRLD